MTRYIEHRLPTVDTATEGEAPVFSFGVISILDDRMASCWLVDHADDLEAAQARVTAEQEAMANQVAEWTKFDVLGHLATLLDLVTTAEGLDAVKGDESFGDIAAQFADVTKRVSSRKGAAYRLQLAQQQLNDLRHDAEVWGLACHLESFRGDLRLHNPAAPDNLQWPDLVADPKACRAAIRERVRLLEHIDGHELVELMKLADRHEERWGRLTEDEAGN